MSSLRPVSTKSASSKGNMNDTHWGGEAVLTSKLNDDDGEVQHIGRHEVLLQPAKAAKKRRKKFDKYLTITPEVETPLPVSPEKRGGRGFSEVLEMKSDDDEVDGPFTFRRKPHIRYHMPRKNIHDWPWIVDEEGYEEVISHAPARKKYRFSCATLCGQFVGHARRRVGRGGRLAWDRSMVPDDLSSSCDPDMAHNTTSVPITTPEKQQPDLSSSNHKELCQQINGLHFVPLSPSPVSNFEFQQFPLMECSSRPIPSSISTPGGLAFGGFSSDSEFQGEALSFSSLPTSLFALKPSTSDLSGDAQCDYYEKMSRTQQHRRLMGESRTPGGSPTTPSSGDGRSTPNFPMTLSMGTFLPSFFQPYPKPHPHHDHRADPSRSSLSVADSKTIILTSAKQQLQPPPPPQPQKPKTETACASSPSLPSTVPFTPPTPTPQKDSSKMHPFPTQSGSEDTSGRTHPPTSCSTPFSSLNGPSHCMLKLNSPQWVADDRPGGGNKATCKITVETALLITSQLMEHAEVVKKEEGGHASKMPPTPTPREPPPPSQLTSPPPASRVEGVLPPEKRGVVTLQQNNNKRIPTSNGNSFPDLFHSATRRLSETERGLKQALAGSVINHAGSLVEATTNSLVQLGNSSEVT